MVVQGTGTARFYLSEAVVFHESQGNTRLCGQHVINNLLQQPKIDGSDLKRATEQIDTNEAMIMGQNPNTQFKSENASTDGYFNVPVIEHVLQNNQCQMKVLTQKSPGYASPAALCEAYMINRSDHWFCLRKIRSVWYEIDSLKKEPMAFTDSEVNLKIKNYVNTGTVFTVTRVDQKPMSIPDDWITDLPHARGALASHQALHTQKEAKAPPTTMAAPFVVANQTAGLAGLPAEPEKGVTIAVRLNITGAPPKRFTRKFEADGAVKLVVAWLRVLLPEGNAQLSSSAPPPKKLHLRDNDLFTDSDEKVTGHSLRDALLTVASSTGESFNLTKE